VTLCFRVDGLPGSGVLPKPVIRHVLARIVSTRASRHADLVDVLPYVSAEIIYCRERARQARERAEATTAAEAKRDHLAAEERWLALAHSHELQQRLSTMLHEQERSGSDRTGSIARMARERGGAFDPEVVVIMSSAFSAVFADLGLSDHDEAVAIRAARRIIELASVGERDLERLKAATIRWVTEWAREKPADLLLARPTKSK
jgi:hypothetical protein